MSLALTTIRSAPHPQLHYQLKELVLSGDRRHTLLMGGIVRSKGQPKLRSRPLLLLPLRASSDCPTTYKARGVPKSRRVCNFLNFGHYALFHLPARRPLFPALCIEAFSLLALSRGALRSWLNDENKNLSMVEGAQLCSDTSKLKNVMTPTNMRHT
eukprot:scaffold80072_cov30-Tisochrysis_lutea.AAC.1